MNIYIYTREVILTSAGRILETFYFLKLLYKTDSSHTDCFMSNPLVGQSSVDFTVTDQHNIKLIRRRTEKKLG